MRRLGEIVLEFSRRGAWATLGFAGIGHYAEARLGLPATVLADRVAGPRRLARFPLLRDAYDRGLLGLDACSSSCARSVAGPSGRRGTRLARSRPRGHRQAAARRGAGARAARSRLTPEATDGSLHPTAWRRGWSLHPDCLVAADGELPEIVLSSQAVEHQRMRNRSRTVESPRPPRTAASPLRRHLGRLAAPRSRRRAPPRAAGRTAGARTRPGRFPSATPAGVAGRRPARRSRDRPARPNRTSRQRPVGSRVPDEPALPSVLAARMFSVRARRAPAWVGLLALLEEAALAWDDPRAFPERAADPIYRRDASAARLPAAPRARRSKSTTSSSARAAAATTPPTASRSAPPTTPRSTNTARWPSPERRRWGSHGHGSGAGSRRYRCERRLSETRSSKSAPG